MPLFIVLLLIAAAPTFAQEQQSPRERALLERIGSEINSGIACATNVMALLDKVKELEAKLKATEISKPEVPKTE